MKKIQDQIYSYKFPYTNIINKYKPSIIKKYSEEFDNRVKTGQPFSDFHFQDTDFTNEICPSLEKIVKNNWYTGNILVKQGLRVYIQTDAYFTSVFHSHEHLLGSIACVFYVNIPKEGGEIEFEYSGNKGPNGYNQIIKPEEDTVYFFLCGYHIVTYLIKIKILQGYVLIGFIVVKPEHNTNILEIGGKIFSYPGGFSYIYGDIIYNYEKY